MGHLPATPQETFAALKLRAAPAVQADEPVNESWTSPEGFERLGREHQAMVFRTLLRLTGPGAHVEDLAQEVFLRLYRALPEFRGAAMLSTYLYRIVVNVAQDEWKRRRRERAHFAPEPVLREDDEPGTWLENQPGEQTGGEHHHTPEQVFSDAETQAVVEGALQALPEHERAVLVLFHQEDCSYEGIAAALGMPINTVRTHLHRGRRRLAGLVAERLGSQRRPTGEPVQAGIR